MSLDNLVGKSLEKIEPDPKVIKRLISSAKRNIADYSGDLVPLSALNECIQNAEKLLAEVTEWLEKNRPDLLA